jgi:hypothetical protein
VTICAKNSVVHRRIQGISSCPIKHCIFANPIYQLNQTRWYWIPVSGYLWQSHRLCWLMVELPVNRRIVGISSWQIQNYIFVNFVWQSRWYSVLLSEYEPWAHLFVAMPQRLMSYHRSSGTPLIRIPESWKLRYRSGILGSNAAVASGLCLACDWRSCTTVIFNPVQNEHLGYVWNYLSQAASHYGCIILA